MVKQKSLGFIVLVTAALAVTACSDKSENSFEQAETPAATYEVASADALADQMASVQQQLRTAIGMAEASTHAQCRLVEVGARPCGGPEYYMAYSTASADAEEVEALAEQYTNLQRQLNEQERRMGTCEVIPKPVVNLEGGRCVAAKTVSR